MTRVDATRRRALRVLMMVGELHKLGYQQARISPGMSPSGMHWRCLVTPADNIRREHGALAVDHDEELVAFYTSGQENEYFGWSDARRATARQLADMFVERFPIIAERSLGEDWLYAGWYVQMLGVAERGHFPMAYNDWDDRSQAAVLPTVSVGNDEPPPELPLPPGGLAHL